MNRRTCSSRRRPEQSPDLTSFNQIEFQLGKDSRREDDAAVSQSQPGQALGAAESHNATNLASDWQSTAEAWLHDSSIEAPDDSFNSPEKYEQPSSSNLQQSYARRPARIGENPRGAEQQRFGETSWPRQANSLQVYSGSLSFKKWKARVLLP